MTETPETDAAEWGITPNDMVVRSGLARKLECERDNALSDWRQADTDSIRALNERNEARQQRDRLAKALEECREDSIELLEERSWWKNEPRCDYGKRYKDIENNIARADAALAAVKLTNQDD